MLKQQATLKDVAKMAGVSEATVSYVFNGKKKISEATKQRVDSAIKELDYVPNLSARSLAAKSSKLIGVVIPQTEAGSTLMLENEFYAEILGSIEFFARKEGYHIIVSATDFDGNYNNLAKTRNLDGIIVIGMYPNEFFKQMNKVEVPIILIDSYCSDYYFHNIRIDDAYGSFLATKHIIDNGHKNIAFFCGEIKENGVMKKRLLGYKKALSDAGLKYNESLIFEGTIDHESGITLAHKLKESAKKATAVVCAADVLAIGAIKGFFEQGMSVPGDISIIGFDDLKIAQYLTPGLSTIKQEISLKGEKAVEVLMENLKDKELARQEIVLPVSVVSRGSVKNIT